MMRTRVRGAMRSVGARSQGTARPDQASKARKACARWRRCVAHDKRRRESSRREAVRVSHSLARSCAMASATSALAVGSRRSSAMVS
eukprot:6195779-Pleurochrysis_carterae.AAC.2